MDRDPKNFQKGPVDPTRTRKMDPDPKNGPGLEKIDRVPKIFTLKVSGVSGIHGCRVHFFWSRSIFSDPGPFFGSRTIFSGPDRVDGSYLEFFRTRFFYISKNYVIKDLDPSAPTCPAFGLVCGLKIALSRIWTPPPLPAPLLDLWLFFSKKTVIF